MHMKSRHTQLAGTSGDVSGVGTAGAMTCKLCSDSAPGTVGMCQHSVQHSHQFACPKSRNCGYPAMDTLRQTANIQQAVRKVYRKTKNC